MAGEVDLSSLGKVQGHLDAALDNGDCLLVIDLERVSFVDSAMMHMLLRTLRRARFSGGDMAVVCTDRNVRRTLEIFGLTAEVRLHRSVPDAAGALLAANPA